MLKKLQPYIIGLVILLVFIFGIYQLQDTFKVKLFERGDGTNAPTPKTQMFDEVPTLAPENNLQMIIPTDTPVVTPTKFNPQVTVSEGLK